MIMHLCVIATMTAGLFAWDDAQTAATDGRVEPQSDRRHGVVSEVRLEPDGARTLVVIEAAGVSRVRRGSLPDPEWPRVFVDLEGVELGLDQYDYAPARGGVLRLRTGVRESGAVRVVADLVTADADLAVVRRGDAIVMSVPNPAGNFQPWSTSRGQTSASAAGAAAGATPSSLAAGVGGSGTESVGAVNRPTEGASPPVVAGQGAGSPASEVSRSPVRESAEPYPKAGTPSSWLAVLFEPVRVQVARAASHGAALASDAGRQVAQWVQGVHLDPGRMGVMAALFTLPILGGALLRRRKASGQPGSRRKTDLASWKGRRGARRLSLHHSGCECGAGPRAARYTGLSQDAVALLAQLGSCHHPDEVAASGRNCRADSQRRRPVHRTQIVA